MIQTVIFDIGGVLIGFDWPGYLRTYGFEEEKAAAISAALIEGPVWKELDRGIWSMDELMDGFVSRAPQYAEDVRRVFLNSWKSLTRQDFAIPWITDLKARGYRVYFLSNYSEWMIEKSKETLDFLPHLDGGIFSCDVKQIKPDEDIYRSLLERYPDIRPSTAVFLDDSPANVETARRLGFHGIVVQSHAQAAADLETLLHET